MASFTGSIPVRGGLGLRPAAKRDEPLLLQLFMEARPWLSWADADRDVVRALYEQQYRAMRAGQEALYPEHLDLVIERTGQAVGRLVVDLGYADWRISELAVLAAARGKGIGSDLVRSLQSAAATMRLPITLSTPMFGSIGRAVYERLDFTVTAIRPPHYEMAWSPPGVPASPADMGGAGAHPADGSSWAMGNG